METRTGNRRGRRSRGEILDAAARVMSERGYAGTSMSALSETTGLPKSAIYHHFGSKEGLLSAVLSRGAEDFYGRLRGMPLNVPEGDVRDRLEALLLRSLEAFAASGPFVRLYYLMLLTDDDASPDVSKVLTQVREEGRGQMRRLITIAFEPEGEEAAKTIGAELDYFGISGFDGAFIGSHAEDEHSFDNRMAQLAEAIAALGQARLAALQST